MYDAKKPRPKFEGKYAELSERILDIFFKVYQELGYGFNEKVYQKAFVIALLDAGFRVEEQKSIRVYFRGQLVGEYDADIVVNDVIMLELKAVKQILDDHEAQLLNYLKASEIEVGYVLNFGPTANFKRKVYDNDRKGSMNWIKK